MIVNDGHAPIRLVGFERDPSGFDTTCSKGKMFCWNWGKYASLSRDSQVCQPHVFWVRLRHPLEVRDTLVSYWRDRDLNICRLGIHRHGRNHVITVPLVRRDSNSYRSVKASLFVGDLILKASPHDWFSDFRVPEDGGLFPSLDAVPPALASSCR